MTGSINKVIIVGNLVANPEIRRLNSGNQVANLRIVTSEKWRDKNTNERKERAEWHNVVIFNENLIKISGQYLKKGMKIYLEGQLQTRKWKDQNNNDRYITEIVLQKYRGELQMLDSRSDGKNLGQPFIDSNEYSENFLEENDEKETSLHNNLKKDTDDEVPF